MFDMDGLMFDTERIGRDGWHKAAEILHIDLPEKIIAAMRGTGTDRCREIFNAKIPGSLYDTAHDLRLRYADEVIAANGVPVKPGRKKAAPSFMLCVICGKSSPNSASAAVSSNTGTAFARR